MDSILGFVICWFFFVGTKTYFDKIIEIVKHWKQSKLKKQFNKENENDYDVEIIDI